MKGILRFWWLILAWLLAMFGDNFWEFNAMEVFASLAIIAGVIWAGRNWIVERRRLLNLIHFPNNWSARYNEGKQVIDFKIYANVLIPFHAYQFRVRIRGGCKQLPTQNIDTGQPMINKEGKIFLTGEIPVSEIPKGVTGLDICATITLDGAVKKSSGKRNICITDFALSESHKEESQTE